MRDYAGFAALVFLILIALSGVWFAAWTYSETRPRNTYQTPLVQTLAKQTKQAPIIWMKGGSWQWLKAQFSQGVWLSEETDLATKLAETKPNGRLLFFDHRSPQALPLLREMFKKEDRWKNTIFCSRNDGILKDLRELEPQWSFCSGEISLTKHMAINSLGLPAWLDFTADVFYVHLNRVKPEDHLKALIAEARKQNKLIFMGPVARPLEGFAVDGWVLQN